MPDERRYKFPVSFTRMQLFDTCPQAYEGRYIARLPELVSAPLENGRRGHGVIEQYRVHLQHEQKERDLAAVPGIVEAAYENDPEVRSTDGFRDTWFLAYQFAQQYRHDFERVLGMETFLSRKLGDFPTARGIAEVEVRGFADMIYWDALPGDPRPHEFNADKIIVARDEKTGWDATLSDSHHFQGEIYDWLMMPQFYPNPLGYEVSFTRHNIISQRVQIQERDEARIEARMRAIVTRMLDAHDHYYQRHGSQPDAGHDGEIFPARPASHCKFCTVAARCASRTVLVHQGMMVDSHETAQLALGDLIILQAALKQREKQLRDWVSGAGPVSLNGQQAGYFTSDTITIDSVQGVIEALGLDGALDLMRLDGRKLKTKRVQNDPRLAHLWKPTNRTAWAVKNVGEQRLVPAIEGDTEEE